MPTKFTHRWEQIKEFVPGCRATGTSGQLKRVSSGSGNTSLPPSGRVNKLNERDPNIRKAPKQVKTDYKPPVIVTSTPSVRLLQPSTPKIKPLSSADDDLPEILLPPGYLSTYTEVEIITTRNVQNSNGTGLVFTSIETSFSISVQAETSTISTHTFGGGSKPSSAATTKTGTSSHTPRPEHHSEPHQVTKNENRTSLTTTQTRVEAARRTGSLIIPANVADVPPGPDHTPSTLDPTKPRSCQGGDTTIKESSKMKQGPNTIDNGTSTVQDILPTPGFNWADDALDEEDQPRAMPLLLKGKGRQFNPNTLAQKCPAKGGPRWAEIITPVHFSHRGGPTTLILTTVGVGADIFTGWETVTNTLAKRMLSVILEEPIHHGLHEIATKNAARKGVNAGTSTQTVEVDVVKGVKASGELQYSRLQNMEGIPATASKGGECISSQCVSDGSAGQQPAGGNDMMKEITDPPDNNCLPLNYHENTSAFPLVLLLLWVPFILYPIAP